MFLNTSSFTNLGKFCRFIFPVYFWRCSVIFVVYVCNMDIGYTFARKKIAAVVATQKAVLDKDHPEIMEEARYWVHVNTKRNTCEKARVGLETRVDVATNASTVNALLTDFTDKNQATARSATDIAAHLKQLQSAASADPGGGLLVVWFLFDFWVGLLFLL